MTQTPEQTEAEEIVREIGLQSLMAHKVKRIHRALLEAKAEQLEADSKSCCRAGDTWMGKQFKCHASDLREQIKQLE